MVAERGREAAVVDPAEGQLGPLVQARIVRPARQAGPEPSRLPGVADGLDAGGHGQAVQGSQALRQSLQVRLPGDVRGLPGRTRHEARDQQSGPGLAGQDVGGEPGRRNGREEPALACAIHPERTRTRMPEANEPERARGLEPPGPVAEATLEHRDLALGERACCRTVLQPSP